MAATSMMRVEEPSRRLTDLDLGESDISCVGQGMRITFRLSTRLTSKSTKGLWFCICDSFSDGLGGASKLATRLTSESTTGLWFWARFPLGLPTWLASESTTGVSFVDVRIFVVF
jgi:hypothetical protein